MRVNSFVPSESIFNQDIMNKKESNSISGQSFSDVLKDNLEKLNEKQIEADNKTEALVAGKPIEVHEVMLSMEEAKMSLQLAVQVRNKMVEAVQELNRMQL